MESRIDRLRRRQKQSSDTLPIVALHAMNVNSSLRRKSPSSGYYFILMIFVILFVFLALGVFVNFIPNKASLIAQTKKARADIHRTEQNSWHGGHPSQERPGSCWCGGDAYCMCTPSLAVDIVIYSKTSSPDAINIWVVRRADTGQLATIGGFVNVGETTETAALRETEEETGIVITSEQAKSAMRLIGVYPDPRRDNRRHIVSVAYALEFTPGNYEPKAGDDAKEVISVPLDEIGVKYKGENWYADHLTILWDFKRMVINDDLILRNGELYQDIARSTCLSSV